MCMGMVISSPVSKPICEKESGAFTPVGGREERWNNADFLRRGGHCPATSDRNRAQRGEARAGAMRFTEKHRRAPDEKKSAARGPRSLFYPRSGKIGFPPTPRPRDDTPRMTIAITSLGNFPIGARTVLDLWLPQLTA